MECPERLTYSAIGFCVFLKLMSDKCSLFLHMEIFCLSDVDSRWAWYTGDGIYDVGRIPGELWTVYYAWLLGPVITGSELI